MGFRGTARYELIRKLGEGGMGIVYEAYDRTRHMRVALKTLRNVDADNLYRLKREFRALCNLSHPNIVNLYDLVSEGESWFLTMELVDGRDLVSYVRDGRMAELPPSPRESETDDQETATAETQTGQAQRSSHGLMSYFGTAGLPSPASMRAAIEDVVDVTRLRATLGQLAEALHALHSANLVHRDLKPSNVRVTADGRLVLMDFGVVADMHRADDEPAIRAVGTPQYMAPEQARGMQPTAAADWYAFGVLMYLAMTGHLPYEGPRPQIMRTKQERDPLPPSLFTEGIPQDLERLCMELLSREPAERPTSQEVLDRLGIVISDTTTSAEFPVLDVATGLFVGRVRELRLLREAYSAARTGGGVLVLVQGPSGIGKSFLVERFLFELRIQGKNSPLVLSGRCQARESVAYKAFDGVIDALSRHLLEMDEDTRRELMPAEAGFLARLFPALGWLAEHEGALTFSGHTPIEQRARAVRALRALLERLARMRPVVIHTEDMQWVDRDSVDLLGELLGHGAPPRLMVLSTLRTDDLDAAGTPLLADVLDPARADIDVRAIHVGPLSEGEQRELMRKMAQLPEYRGVSQYIDDPLWRESAGNPMLLAELARSTQDAPHGQEQAGALHLEDVIWGRFIRLGDSARALMECVALAGEPLPLRVLAWASDLSDSDSERASAVLRVGHLCRITRTSPEPWLVVYHSKVREAIYKQLPAARLVAVHRRLAEALETWSEAPVAALAEHWLAAGERGKAAIYRCQTARHAADTLAFDRAAELYRSVLELLCDAPAESVFEIARCRAWIGLAEGLVASRGDDRALELLDRARVTALAHGLVDELAAIHHLRGTVLFPRGDLDGSLAEHEKARDYAQRARSPEREARALAGLGDVHYTRGRIESARQCFDRCIVLCREHGLGDVEAANLSMRGLTRLFQNDLASALEDSMSAAAAALRIGHRRAEVMARASCTPWALFEMGHIHQARRELEDALALARELGMQRYVPLGLAHLARIMALKGRRAKAVQLAEESVVVCRETDMAFAGPLALGTLIVVVGERSVRERAMVEAEAILAAGAASHNYFYFYRDAMEAALVEGAYDDVERLARALDDYTRAEPVPWCRFFADRGRALAAHASGSGDVSVLRRLVNEARKASLHTAARALEQALAEAER